MKVILLLSCLSLAPFAFAQESVASDATINVQTYDRTKLDPNPYTELQRTIDAARAKKLPFAHAGAFATGGKRGVVTRIMEIGKIAPQGIVFYTNAPSGKLSDMRENQRASFVLFSHNLAPTVVINGTIDLNYSDPASKKGMLNINGEQVQTDWIGFLFKPDEFEFSQLSPVQGSWRVSQSYVYRRNGNGGWDLSQKEKDYPIFIESSLYCD
jgi:hypothetical protein